MAGESSPFSPQRCGSINIGRRDMQHRAPRSATDTGSVPGAETRSSTTRRKACQQPSVGESPNRNTPPDIRPRMAFRGGRFRECSFTTPRLTSRRHADRRVPNARGRQVPAWKALMFTTTHKATTSIDSDASWCSKSDAPSRAKWSRCYLLAYSYSLACSHSDNRADSWIEE